VTKSGDLRKDEPDPVTGLSPGSEFREDGVIGMRLGVEEALKVVDVGHGLTSRRFCLLDVIPFLEVMPGTQKLDILGGE